MPDASVPTQATDVQEKPNRDYRRLFATYSAYFLLVALVLVMTSFNPNFLNRYNVQTILDQVAVLVVIALGQMFVIMLGSIDLSVGATASLVSVIFALSVARFGYWSYVFGLAAGLLAGLANGLLLAKLKIPSFIATLGTLGIFRSLAFLFANGAPVQIPYAYSKYLGVLTGTTLGLSRLHLFALLVLVAFFVVGRFTKTGRAISAIGSAERASWISGLNVDRTKIIALTLSGLTAGIAGVFLASQLLSGTPSVGLPYQLESIAAVVVGGTALTGGVGGVVQTLVGALIMALLSNGMNVIGVNIYAQQIVTGIVVVAAVGLTLDRSKIAVIK
ncbi:MAG: ABC transporter permease [Bacteroidota bacterium]